LLQERGAAEAALADLAVAVSQRALAPLDAVQAQLPADAALLAWVDVTDASGAVQEHWGCVLRREGPPAWVRLPGTGTTGAWTPDDAQARGELRRQLADPPLSGGGAWQAAARRLAAQRLDPLAPHLEGVRRLIVCPAARMSGLPVEVLSEAFTVSYAPSATLYARLAASRPQRRGPPALLALGDPAFGSSGYAPLPGTRREVEALAALFPTATKLLGDDASEPRLDALAARGELKRYRYLHLATHGEVHPPQASRCALVLAQASLPDPLKQAQAGQKVYDGKVSVREILDTWQLDADLVVLSACNTGLGQEAGGDGLMGFAQALLSAGARSLVVSLWPVDDTATALLMVRFYQNLLGGRAGSVSDRRTSSDRSSPLGKAEALRAAKAWLRNLAGDQAAAQLARLPKLERGGERTRPGATAAEARPYAHPYYWSTFILIGDPD
jgi:CHAT domain-containing protein